MTNWVTYKDVQQFVDLLSALDYCDECDTFVEVGHDHAQAAKEEQEPKA